MMRGHGSNSCCPSRTKGRNAANRRSRGYTQYRCHDGETQSETPPGRLIAVDSAIGRLFSAI